MKRWHSTPFQFLKLRKLEVLAKVPTMILSETRGLQLFWVIQGGIRLKPRLKVPFKHTKALTTY